MNNEVTLVFEKLGQEDTAAYKCTATDDMDVQLEANMVIDVDGISEILFDK